MAASQVTPSWRALSTTVSRSTDQRASSTNCHAQAAAPNALSPRLTRRVTAFEFLTVDLPAVALEEPRRMRMAFWIEDAAIVSVPSMRPACGTVCCIGGWTEMMVYGADLRYTSFRFKSAGDLLGIDVEQRDELFQDHDLMYAATRRIWSL